MAYEAIHIIGGGMAGTEAAWQIIQQDIPVILHEMRPIRKTDVHQTDGLAEMVCSNSFRSDDPENNAVGLLHEEMRRCNSLIMAAATNNRVPAGSALAVDRDGFSRAVQARLQQQPLFTLIREEIVTIPAKDSDTGWDNVIIATGPLTSDALARSILELTGDDQLAFFDAIAPIIYKDSIDFSQCWLQSRYDKGDSADYINLPLNREQYETLIDDLTDSEKHDYKDWEKDTPCFDGCLPVEVMAARGRETLRYGPMKPVGLTNPHSGEAAYAVLQLRQDNHLGTLYNMVGFQTKMTYSAQIETFRKIPGLKQARFARLGGLHRNIFINSPDLLDTNLRFKALPHLRFAGQISGVEGYVESAAMGLMAGRFAAANRKGHDIPPPPVTTAFGALIHYITGGQIPAAGKRKNFQPMNINFGIMPPLDGKKIKRKDRKPVKSRRALEALDQWLQQVRYD
ncbi:MAG: methylenetetrahydrofolate--tRNA-(uracil(54)-C(5))-methyltransferase (FADH(2)-oxidizing) TrmFO [Alphaproteobacteria bacterium]|nr:methylenetetrahydrofolate--tRNA-(uracil(54)-C(5))-methyltransferase (FADH(2)-oxidizing) TrmFO [Alphaproteobacteria bacterium]